MDETQSPALLSTLDKRWNDYYFHLKLSCQQISSEVVRDLRVSTRRLLSLLEFIRSMAPSSRLQQMRRSLNDQLDKLDELRDVQLMKAEICQVPDEAQADVKPFMKYLNKQEKKLLKSAADQIPSFKKKSLSRRIGMIRKSLSQLTLSSGIQELQLLEPMDEAFSVVMRRSEFLDANRPATIHRLRIAFRKFRYLMEIINPILPAFPKENLAEMREYQKAMGKIQDIEILLDHLAEFAETKSSFKPETIINHFQKAHQDGIAAFILDAPACKKFWRASNTAPFPWSLDPSKEPAKVLTAEQEKPPTGNNDDEEQKVVERA